MGFPDTALGGGIPSESGLLSISGSAISGNKAFYGGGIYLRSPGPSQPARLDLSEYAITNNTALSAGGGLYIFGGTVNSTNNTLSNNVAVLGDGGAIAIDWSSLFFPVVTMTNNTIAYNRATVNGGGVSVAIGAANGTLRLKNSVIVGNAAANNRDADHARSLNPASIICTRIDVLTASNYGNKKSSRDIPG